MSRKVPPLGPIALGIVFLVLSLLWAPGARSTARAQNTNDERVTKALGQLDILAQQNLSRTGVPGVAISVVHRDRVVYLKGFGVTAMGRNEAVDGDTVFQLASVSKPIASTVMAALVSDGVVDWDDPIVRHDPEFQIPTPG